MDYTEYAKVMKALSDSKRVKILDLLSCGTLCACDVLEHFDFTQPTLSYHIKVLVDAGLIATEKKGIWHHYSIHQESANKLVNNTKILFSTAETCICVSDEGQKKKINDEKVNASYN